MHTIFKILLIFLPLVQLHAQSTITFDRVNARQLFRSGTALDSLWTAPEIRSYVSTHGGGGTWKDDSANYASKSMLNDTAYNIRMYTNTKMTQYADVRLLYVDGDRAATYIPDGSESKPFHFIQDAENAIPNDSHIYSIIIKRNSSNYVENVTITKAIQLIGLGRPRINGNVIIDGSSTVEVSGIDILGTTSIINTQSLDIFKCEFYSTVTTSSISTFDHCAFFPVSGKAIRQLSSTTILHLCNIVAGNDTAIVQHSGTLNINNSSIQNTSANYYTVASKVGQLLLSTDMIINNAGTLALSCNNNAYTSPNLLINITAVGNITAGTAVTYSDGLIQLIGTITGNYLQYRAGTHIANIPSGNISAVNVQNAINELDAEKIDTSATELKSYITKVAHDSLSNFLRKSTVTVSIPDSVWVVTDGQAQRAATTTISYGYSIPAYAAGTVYSLTTSFAKVDFGTIDPQVTLNVAGTYKITACVTVQATAATISTNRTYSFALKEVTNTSAYLTNSTTPSMYTGIMTTLTQNLAVVTMPAVYYTTTSTTDLVQIWGALSGSIDAGSVQVIGAYIIAELIY